MYFVPEDKRRDKRRTVPRAGTSLAAEGFSVPAPGRLPIGRRLPTCPTWFQQHRLDSWNTCLRHLRGHDFDGVAGWILYVAGARAVAVELEGAELLRFRTYEGDVGWVLGWNH